MRLYAASDFHGKYRYGETIKAGIRRSRADAVVLAGDILNYRRNPDLLRFLDDLSVPVFLVRGNSDPAFLERWAAQSRNVRSLHLNPVVLDGVGLVGLSGTLPLPFHSRVGWHEPRMLRRLAPLVQAGMIVVAHPPPRGCRDRVLGRWPAGSRGMSRLLRQTAPAVMVCGHIHEAAGVDRWGDTLVVNCALGPEWRGARIVIEDGRAPSAEML
jgi:Icc-related predicted phosphoesterase